MKKVYLGCEQQNNVQPVLPTNSKWMSGHSEKINANSQSHSKTIGVAAAKRGVCRIPQRNKMCSVGQRSPPTTGGYRPIAASSVFS